MQIRADTRPRNDRDFSSGLSRPFFNSSLSNVHRDVRQGNHFDVIHSSVCIG